MAKLVHSKEQRLIIYKTALKFYIDNPDIQIGICACLKVAQRKLNKKRYVSPYHRIHQFPEIAKHEPKDKYIEDYWFHVGNRERRIEIFNSAINELQNEN